MVYDVIVIGAGPAGLTAGIYGKRASLNILVLQDKYSIGSQICNTYEVCNYPGFNNIDGEGLYNAFLKHATELNVPIVKENVIEINDIEKSVKKVVTKNATYETKTIVLAMGAKPKLGGFDGENEYVGKGISYCATCDGAFYKNKTVAVIGGGDVAVEDAIFLSRIAKKVYLIVRRNEMRATKILQEEVKKLENVEIFYEMEVVKIFGNDIVEGVLIKKKGDMIPSELTIDGLFVGIGITPNVELVNDKLDIIDGYVKADETCETSIEGIYAIGDIRKKQLRQVITACADGANVITSVERYLISR